MSHKDFYEYGDQRSPYIVHHWGQRLHKDVYEYGDQRSPVLYITGETRGCIKMYMNTEYRVHHIVCIIGDTRGCINMYINKGHHRSSNSVHH